MNHGRSCGGEEYRIAMSLYELKSHFLSVWWIDITDCYVLRPTLRPLEVIGTYLRQTDLSEDVVFVALGTKYVLFCVWLSFPSHKVAHLPSAHYFLF